MKMFLVSLLLLTNLTMAAESYFFDVQFSSNTADSVSVEIDASGKGLKAFEGELTSDFGETTKTGTFLEVSQFSIENNGDAVLKFIVKKRIFSHWQVLDDGRKNPIFESVKIDMQVDLKLHEWTSLGAIPGKEQVKVRLRNRE